LVKVSGKDGREIGVGDRVVVDDGPHTGSGTVDAVDPDASKVWVMFDPLGPGYPYIFWVDATHTTKT
jgi:transcription antitermination factor NusG